MPQLVLEFSQNILEKKLIPSFFEKYHRLLSEHLPTEIMSCKSRSYETTLYSIGDNKDNHAFVHITLKVLAGRSAEKLSLVGDLLMSEMKTHFSESLNQFNLQLSIEIKELSKHYLKFSKIS